MTERPIIMQSESVHAILAGAKTQTRRVAKPQPKRITHIGPMRAMGWSLGGCEWLGEPTDEVLALCPYGAVGDRLWVITIRPVPGFEDRYGVGDDGRVYRTDGGEPRPMRPGLTSKGYQTVTLCREGSRKTALVHHLVCAAFYGPRPSAEHEVRHLDGCRTNNVPENLDWGTRSQNWGYKRAVGRSVRDNHHAAKLTSQQAAELAARGRNGETQRALAREFGIAQSTACNIILGKTWRQSPPPAPPKHPRWACRLVLEAESVRVERLHNITHADAVAEGCKDDDPKGYLDARDYYSAAWERINGKRKGCSWSDNPWVWVVGFKRVQPNDDDSRGA